MFFWLSLIIATASIVFLLLHAFGKRDGVVIDRHYCNNQSDVVFYKSQIIEINNEELLKKISPENAKEARLELARRIIDSQKNNSQIQLSSCARVGNDFFKYFVFIGILFIIVGSWGLYLLIGSPDLSQKPFEILMSKDDFALSLSEKIVKNEALLARNPDTEMLMDKLADYYLEAGRFREAVNILNRSLSINGKTYQRFLSYGIALTGVENGIVTKDAENAFQQAAEISPKNLQPQLFLARGLMQNGQQKEALALLEKFVYDHGQGQEWALDLQEFINQVKENKTEIKTILTKQQHDFIVANIANLEQKLSKTPQDVEGWVMLINAYILLEKPVEVRISYLKALQVLSVENSNKFLGTLNKKALSLEAFKEEQ